MQQPSSSPVVVRTERTERYHYRNTPIAPAFDTRPRRTAMYIEPRLDIYVGVSCLLSGGGTDISAVCSSVGDMVPAFCYISRHDGGPAATIMLPSYEYEYKKMNRPRKDRKYKKMPTFSRNTSIHRGSRHRLSIWGKYRYIHCKRKTGSYVNYVRWFQY